MPDPKGYRAPKVKVEDLTAPSQGLQMQCGKTTTIDFGQPLLSIERDVWMQIHELRLSGRFTDLVRRIRVSEKDYHDLRLRTADVGGAPTYLGPDGELMMWNYPVLFDPTIKDNDIRIEMSVWRR